MTKQEAIKEIWKIISTQEKIKEAEEIARGYNIQMAFDEEYIMVEDDIFYLNR